MSDISVSDPFFIIGSPRSGTTLLEVILDSHSDVAVCPEIFTGRLLYRFNISKKISDQWKSLYLLNEQYQLSKHFTDPVTECLAKLALKNLQFPMVTSDWFRLFIKDYLHSKSAVVYGEKTPENTLFLKPLRQVFPEAKYIIIIRNPFDTVLSICEVADTKLKVGISSSFLLRFASIVKRGLRELYVERRLEKCESIQIRYEDLITDTVPTIQNLCAFLNIKYEDEMLQFQNRKKFHPDSELLPKIHALLNEPLTAARINRSFSILPKQQIAMLYAFLYPEIIHTPYEYSIDRSIMTLRDRIHVQVAKFAFKLGFYKVAEFRIKCRFQLRYCLIRLLHNTPLSPLIFKKFFYKKEQWKEILAKASSTCN